MRKRKPRRRPKTRRKTKILGHKDKTLKILSTNSSPEGHFDNWHYLDCSILTRDTSQEILTDYISFLGNMLNKSRNKSLISVQAERSCI